MKSPYPAHLHRRLDPRATALLIVVILAMLGAAVGIWYRFREFGLPTTEQPSTKYQARHGLDESGFAIVCNTIPAWTADAALVDIADRWRDYGRRAIQEIEQHIAEHPTSNNQRVKLMLTQAVMHNYEGEPKQAYDLLCRIREQVERDPLMSRSTLYTLIFYQGVSSLRRGETENCVHCTGEGTCILPLLSTAVHAKTTGSRLAIRHFTEYLERFPEDETVRWLLNLAHMTLGDYPHAVASRHLVDIKPFGDSEFDIGAFRDVSHQVGLVRQNQAGGAIMEDFNNDGLLDLAVTSMDPATPMAFYLNTGHGSFEDQTEAAGLTGQLGGLNCVQTDYDNDGNMDIFIPRGAWLFNPVRPSLLRNNANGTFSDVTDEAALSTPVNSIAASWADYDNDGWLDLFVCCERQHNLLYHNERNGTFREMAQAAGLCGQTHSDCKGAAWIDFDNDGYADLFLNYFTAGGGRLFRNNCRGGFDDVTAAMGIHGPSSGFSCWAWDYDNDGWQDIFATCYDYNLPEAVRGMVGEAPTGNSCRLYHNQNGQGFVDQAGDIGLGQQYATMGSNYGDFDNDGYLDLYLGTGDPRFSALIPNRMFKNVAGRRFSDITGSARTGHLQKGHGVACGDWDRDGDNDLFVEMGGAVPGDSYHNVLFQNPGQGNNWLRIKLVGKITNRAAVGARIKVVTGEWNPLTVCRHISSGSSFGANPLQQTIGLGRSKRVVRLEIDWPASGTKQVFKDLDVNQSLEITELANDFRLLDWQPTAQPDLADLSGK
ncbi:MAG: CRTAC1 family protein [Pirellulales bacterium]